MPPFLLVEGKHAGPDALGILVPPGRRTLVIVRPRTLDFDLVLVCPGRKIDEEMAFWEANPGEAKNLAKELHRALEELGDSDRARVEAVAGPKAKGHLIRAEVAPFMLLACRRVPGQPYQPMVFAGADEAQAAGDRLAKILHPSSDSRQELYFNLAHFSR